MSQNPFAMIQIKVEKENLTSTLAVEQIFAQIHAVSTTITWAMRYLEGALDLWVSCEIVSIGGKINFFVRAPIKHIGLVKTAFYAQYPQAEITDVQDYMEHLQHWDPHHSDWDLWGTELSFVKDNAYPIRTYLEFEHMAAEEKIVDPIAALMEAMSAAEPHELMAVQYNFKPIGDSAWQPEAQKTVDELKKKIAEGVEVKGEVAGEDATMNKVVFTEGEKKVLGAIERKMSKPGYNVKIRLLYIAPKSRFDNTKKTAMVGTFRQFSGMTTNNLKPNMGTWTGHQYKLWKSLEQPYTDWRMRRKKHHLLKGYVERSMWIGGHEMVMNTEEMATLFHFPLSTVKAPPVESIDVKKAPPPQDLPVG